MTRFFLIAAAALALLLTPALAQKPGSGSDSRTAPATTAPASTERIHSLHSDIVIEESGAIVVTETITLTALGNNIQRGPYRDFPTRYRDRHGNRVEVGFDILEVTRDGQPEPYHTDGLRNGVRIFIGQEDVFLQPARYTYTLTYRTTRQLYFGEEHDELYFNITGNGWDFVIEHASATMHLPEGAQVIEAAVYTGDYSSTARNATIDRSNPNVIEFATTQALGSGEGLTVAASWPKGFVEEPSAADRAGSFVQDNAPVVIAFLGLLLSFGYYFRAWNKVGKDPASGTIIPRFEPPANFSPAATRFVNKMRFDQKAFTAAIINMAVKGFLTIKEDGKSFVLEKASGDTSVLSPGEAAIADRLLRTRSSIKLKNDNHTKFSKAISDLKSELRKEYEASNFHNNSDYMIPGFAIALAMIVLTGLLRMDIVAAIFGAAWCIIWGVGAGYLGTAAFRALDDRVSAMSILGAIGSGIGIVVMLIASTMLALMFDTYIGVFALLAFFATGALIPLFTDLMRAPTHAGREMMDEIEGFKMYLATAEKHRLEAFHPPKQTPELFEKYLPYALALEVENKWSEQFDDVLKAASATEGRDGYQPHWYHGTRWTTVGAAGFAHSLGSSMATSVSSAATAPGSSSGAGGGGFSGGGGGGGGGGGW